MKRCICAALALVFLLTLCACGKTGTGSGSAVGGTSSVENIFEQLVQEKTNIEAFSCKKAYTAAKKCLDKQNYDAAAVWLWIAKMRRGKSGRMKVAESKRCRMRTNTSAAATIMQHIFF